MAVTLHTYMSDVSGITIRDVAGDGSQVELLINGHRGLLSLRCIGGRHGTIRITDLRRSDRRKRKVHHPVAGLRAIAKPAVQLVEAPGLAEQLQASLDANKAKRADEQVAAVRASKGKRKAKKARKK
jgi:hypothetical protein